ncbi:chemotaxis protein CheW [Pseudomonas putida]|nr:chemotaxis protein CheW [Pseudomonas putida]
MTNQNPRGGMHFAGYRIGETFCLSPSSAIIAVDEVPKELNQIPGTKPWLMGAGRLDRQLLPFVNISRFLNISRDPTQAAVGTAALFVRGGEGVGNVALVVDEICEFILASELRDCDQSGFKIPPGLGKSTRKAVVAKGRTWALIDLPALIADDKLQNVDLT